MTHFSPEKNEKLLLLLSLNSRKINFDVLAKTIHVLLKNMTII